MANKKKTEKENLKDDIIEKDNCKCDCGCEGECDCDEKHSCDCDHDCGEECQCKKQEDEEHVDYLDMARRIQAEFDNYRKRTVDEIEKSYESGVAIAVLKFLPVLDVLPKAISMASDDATKEGMEMFAKELENSMKSLGVEKIETKGLPFDASVANAVVTIEDEKLEEDVVAEELQAGYKFKNKVIRYAQVVVNKKKK